MRRKSPYFQFRQFRVYHDQCAMKVGTDGVLIGAWTPVETTHRILDVGTGSGLIALMAAQRNPNAQIEAVEIDPDACRQAELNFSLSPWSAQLQVMHASFSDYAGSCGRTYDLIISNPPFFESSLLPPNRARSLARHATDFTFIDFFTAGAALLNPGGSISLIFPYEALSHMRQIAGDAGLELVRACTVRGHVAAPIKRVLTQWKVVESSSKSETILESLVLENADETRSDAYRELTEAYYL